MVEDVAHALARLGDRQWFTGDDELVFGSETGSFADASSLRVRYKAALGRAGPRPLRFHDLRHTFGTMRSARQRCLQFRPWIGHSRIGTTMRYIHHRDRGDEARLLAEAFRQHRRRLRP